MTFNSRALERESEYHSDSEGGDPRALVRLIREGSVAAFEELYRAYWNQLYNFAFRYVQSAEEAEDVVQEVLFSVWRNRVTWNVSGSLQNYLFVAVRNTAIGRLRRDATMRRWREKTVTEANSQSEAPADSLIDSADANAEVERALSEMPTKRRAVCALRWIDGLSYSQIAERLGINEKTVENHIGKGLKFMRERLTPRR
jgi:RNA polymerase sigma-70 factor (ECF subfamily)